MKYFTTSNIFIAALIALNCTLMYKFLQSKNSKKYSIEVNAARDRIYKAANIRIPNNKILIPFTKNLDSNLTTQIQKNDYTLLVLFEPNQCGACLEEKVLWNYLNDNKIIPIFGVTYLKDNKELSQYLNDSETKIPVYQDTSATIGKWISPEGVPAKLLINKKMEIILIDYVRRTQPERDDFVNLLNYYINTSNNAK